MINIPLQVIKKMDQHLNLNIFYNSAALNVCSALSENVLMYVEDLFPTSDHALSYTGFAFGSSDIILEINLIENWKC